MVIKWSSTVRLDDYITVRALRRQIELIDNNNGLNKKPPHKRNEELVTALKNEVSELNATLKTFGVFSSNSSDLKKRVEIMKKIREDLGDVFLYTFRVANSLDVDVSRSVHEKIRHALRESGKPLKNERLAIKLF